MRLLLKQVLAGLVLTAMLGPARAAPVGGDGMPLCPALTGSRGAGIYYLIYVFHGGAADTVPDEKMRLRGRRLLPELAEYRWGAMEPTLAHPQAFVTNDGSVYAPRAIGELAADTAVKAPEFRLAVTNEAREPTFGSAAAPPRASAQEGGSAQPRGWALLLAGFVGVCVIARRRTWY